jgi:hypothetical protein
MFSWTFCESKRNPPTGGTKIARFYRLNDYF